MADETTNQTLFDAPVPYVFVPDVFVPDASITDNDFALAETPAQYWNLGPSLTLTGVSVPPEPRPRILPVEIDGEVHYFEQPRDAQGRLARRATVYALLDKNGNVTGYECAAVEEGEAT